MPRHTLTAEDRRKKSPANKAASKGGYQVPKIHAKKPGPKGTRAHIAAARGVQCGAKRRGGGKCTLAAGWGTPHPGIGKCKFHAGSVPNHVKSAATSEYRKLLGNPLPISPEEAIMKCIHIRAGEVQWLSDEMAKLDRKAWIEDTMVGKQFHLYARERSAAMSDMARFSAMAISLNIEERKVRIAETHGELLANLLRGVLDELLPHLNEEGRREAPMIVRRHLIALSGGLDGQQKQIEEKTA